MPIERRVFAGLKPVISPLNYKVIFVIGRTFCARHGGCKCESIQQCEWECLFQKVYLAHLKRVLLPSSKPASVSFAFIAITSKIAMSLIFAIKLRITSFISLTGSEWDDNNVLLKWICIIFIEFDLQANCILWNWTPGGIYLAWSWLREKKVSFKQFN